MAPASTTSDIEIMKKVASFDSKALEALYNRYSTILYTLIKTIVSDKNFAEEILSDVFVVIWKKVKHFDFRNGNVYVWLITLARNKAVDAMRMKRSGAETKKYSDEYEDQFIIPHVKSDSKSLELKDALNKTVQMQKAMEELTDAQQYVIHLAYFEGLTESEIAAKLNIPVTTVKSKIRIALTNLKENMTKGSDI